MIKRNDGISKDDICQNQFTAYVVLAVKRKRQSYIKKKQREHEKETRTKKEAEQSEFRTAGYDMWSRMEPQNEKLMAAMQQLSLKERFVVTEYAAIAIAQVRASGAVQGTQHALAAFLLEPCVGVVGQQVGAFLPHAVIVGGGNTQVGADLPMSDVDS